MAESHELNLSSRAGALRRRTGTYDNIVRLLTTKPLGAAGAFVVLGMALLALATPLVAPFDPLEAHFADRFKGPSATYLLGTDNFGRDLLSRIFWGARVSLVVGFGAVALGHTIGAVLGVVSGYAGGTADILFQRFVDAMMAFPRLIMALAIVAVMGPSILNVILAIAIVDMPRTARILRAGGLAVKQTQYVEAVVAIGASPLRIILVHVMPNCLAPYLIVATAGLGQAIVVEASLSFLGLGVPPPLPSWGGMLSGVGREYLQQSPWIAIFPGVAISLTVYGFNLLGDAIRDVWDPRLRKA